MSKRTKRKRNSTNHENMLLEDLLVGLRNVCNPLAEEAARRLEAADATFKELAGMAKDVK